MSGPARFGILGGGFSSPSRWRSGGGCSLGSAIVTAGSAAATYAPCDASLIIAGEVVGHFARVPCALALGHPGKHQRIYQWGNVDG